MSNTRTSCATSKKTPQIPIKTILDRDSGTGEVLSQKHSWKNRNFQRQPFDPQAPNTIKDLKYAWGHDILIVVWDQPGALRATLGHFTISGLQRRKKEEWPMGTVPVQLVRTL